MEIVVAHNFSRQIFQLRHEQDEHGASESQETPPPFPLSPAIWGLLAANAWPFARRQHEPSPTQKLVQIKIEVGSNSSSGITDLLYDGIFHGCELCFLAVKEHAPLLARAHVETGVDVHITGDVADKAASGGCCVWSC